VPLNAKHRVIVVTLVIVIIVVFVIVFAETFGAESNPTGNPLGGGPGYNSIISPTDPRVKYVVSNKDQLLNALKSVKSGEVIFVKGDADIDLTGTWGHVIPAGVTLASDRGSGGSAGGRIFRYRTSPPNKDNGFSKIPMLVAGGDNVRITGLRLEGPDKIQDENHEAAGIDIKSAIEAENRTGFEVDNCEIWGWSYAGISLTNGKNSPAVAYIHHNYMHHCQERGYGYGIVIGGGTALIEANLFDYTRHAITGVGIPMEGYEARYNIHLGHGTAIGSHHFDVHAYPTDGQSSSIAGNLYKIHHNTFETTEVECIGIRATPTTGMYIDHNIFNVPPGKPVFKKSYNGNSLRMFVTSNFWNGVLYKSDEIVDYQSDSE